MISLQLILDIIILLGLGTVITLLLRNGLQKKSSSETEDDPNKLDIKELKVGFGKLGKIKVTKFLKDKQFDMPGPDLSSFSIPKNNKEIVPSIKDADASFIKDAIKIAFTFDFK